MRILVTGGAGFIGSHLVDGFLSDGHEVLVLDDLSSGKEANLNEHAVFERIDLRDYERVERLLSSYRPEIVDHHAAQIDVRLSVTDPLLDAQINVLASAHLFASAVRHGARAVLFASSGGTIYGETPRPAVETDDKSPISPYGAAKLAAEGYLFALASSRGVPGIVLRYGNVYGPRQDPTGEAGVVSIFAKALLRGEQPTIFGDGSAVRDYIAVEDVSRANRLAIAHALSGTHAPRSIDEAAFNVGTGVSTSVSDIFGLLASAISPSAAPHYGAARPGELRESRLDATRARDVLHHEAATPLEEGIAKTASWIASRA